METNLGVFKGEMIIICDFIARCNIDFRVDDNLLLSTDGDDLCRAIRVARVVDEPAVRPGSHQEAFSVDEHKNLPKVSNLGRIHH